jgi:hypothetical protein
MQIAREFGMFEHPFRTLGTIAGLLFAALIGWAVTIGGYSLDDPDLEAQGAWVRAFKQDASPELTREIGQQCKKEIGRSPWTRDGASALFTCIRTKAEAQGYHYEWDEEEPSAEG